MEAIRQLDAFLADRGMPRTVAAIHREHVESFIEDQVAQLKPASVANRYRSLQQYFKWLVEEGEIKNNPMAGMDPPTIPEAPSPVLTTEELEKLLRVCEGNAFEQRRDMAVIRLLLDTGIRRAEVTGLQVDDIEFDVRAWIRHRAGDGAAIVPSSCRTALLRLQRYAPTPRRNAMLRRAPGPKNAPASAEKPV